MTDDSALPLSGVSVVDLTHGVAGPFCTHMLQELGAAVVKVERPETGDSFRYRGDGVPGSDPSFVATNYGKRSITLNLAAPLGREVLMKLAAQADIVVENFRPGVTERFEITANDLRKQNERLIFCSITGYGHDGPMAEWVAIDRAVAAVSGVGPLFGGAVDTFTGYAAFAAILTALLQRTQTGQGASLDIAMLDSAMVLNSVHARGSDSGGSERIAPSTMGGSAVFSAADREIYVGAVEQRWFEVVCRLVERPDLASEARFATPALRSRHRHELNALLRDAFRNRTAAEWEEALVSRGVPAGVLRSPAEAAMLPQVQLRKLLAEVPGIDGKRTMQVRSGLGFADPEIGSVPRLGEHTRNVLRELDYSDEEIDRLSSMGVV
jgi:crotonobetainyl-CoA:carnitine CoA-transferase CaiB-like acyl-CoA transferase